jgi:predicted NBD/HSP70 family sugar kinase
VLLDFLGKVVTEASLPLHGCIEPDVVLSAVVKAVEQVLDRSHIDREHVLGVGVGLPGLVRGGRVVVAVPALPEWHDVPLAKQLEQRLGLTVTVENDANLGALAEYQYGAKARDRQWDSLVYVYADRGIGAGIVLDGKLYRGADGLAGQLGHVVIDVDGRQCTCGNYGCLEALASVGSIVRRAVLAAKLGGSTSLGARVKGDWDAISYTAIMEAVAEGDPVAIAAVDEAITYLAVGVSGIMRQFRPQVIVLGGQMFDQRPGVFKALCHAVDNRPSFYGVEPTGITMGELGVRAPSIGAATLILDSFFAVPEGGMLSHLVDGRFTNTAKADSRTRRLFGQPTLELAGRQGGGGG